jgi:NAD+ kinase
MTERTQPVFGLYANTGKQEALDALMHTIRYCESHAIRYLLEDDALPFVNREGLSPSADACGSREDIAGRSDVVITFGGDGTLLAAAQSTLASGTPLLGVNLGKLGFLADVDVEEVFGAIERIRAGRYTIEPRMTITGVLEQRSSFNALNDIVISKSGSAKVINIDSHVNGAFLASFLADGIIVSTPTGSTAYSLATGGPVVVPSSDVIIISPISAHTLTARPIIVSGESRISLSASTEEGTITVMSDGHTIVENRKQVSIDVARGDRNVQLVKDIGPDYFSTLRIKLSWAQDGRFHRDTRNTTTT